MTYFDLSKLNLVETNRILTAMLTTVWHLLPINWHRGSQSGVHVPLEGYICQTERVHLTLAIEGKNIFASYAIPNIRAYISDYYCEIPLYT